MGKRVVFIADSLDNAYKFQQVLSGFDVEISAGSTLQMEKLLGAGFRADLIIFEARGAALAQLASVETRADEVGTPLLVIVDADQAGVLRFLAGANNDFIVHGATEEECAARLRRLLSDGREGGGPDIIAVDNMVINLATYQVTVGGDPIDLTYLEYSLLSFLVRHCGHTFSRDALLQHVWGFDYYGGSRTVDVHVRRIRSKLGPELAQRLETVRGVGYLWNS